MDNDNEEIENETENAEENINTGGKMINVDINNEMRKSFLDYSMAVITSRALPDVRDGLKPVHRRILYTMFENRLFPNVAYRKCADTVGSVLSRYHPHGDASVYDAMVRLAQDFSMRYTLVDGHGNFGSVDGDPPAAYRYTESRMSKLSLEMLTDIDEDAVDFMPNYDDRLKEPVVLPSKFPNILVNGSTGIAVGMATNIPPHNLGETIDAIFCLIDNPDATVNDLMEHIKGPDFPTAGIILGKAGIKAAYAEGRGKITLRARAEIEDAGHGKYKIVVTELPYQVNKARLIESIADLVKDKKIDGIADINDYSNREGMNVVIDLKRDQNPEVILNQLYSYTQLQISYGVIMMALVNGEPKILPLKDILTCYINHQCEVIERRTRFRLKKAEDRIHIVKGLLKALDIIDEVIAVLKASKSIAEGKQALIENFGFDDVQATHIVSMRLGQLTGLERQKLEDEETELSLKISEYKEILGSHEKVLSIIKDELSEIKNKYNDDRRTEIQNVSGEVDIESLIPEEDCIFTLTTLGYIKRQPADSYKIQRRGGKGVIGMGRREEDFVETMFSCSTHDYIMFFTTKGRAYRLKGYEIPEGARTSRGMNVINLLPLEENEKVSAMIRAPKDESEKYICMFTRKGVIKRSSLEDYRNIRKSGVIAITLDDGDELAWVKITNGNEDILLATKKGMAIRFPEKEARPIGRTARGIRAIKLKENDVVIGMDVLNDESSVLTVSETGYGRRSKGSDYRSQSRGGKGITNYKTEKNGDVAALRVVNDDEDLIIISSDGVIIRIPASGVSEFQRPAKGVKVMKVKENEKVATLTAVDHAEETGEDREEPAEEQ